MSEATDQRDPAPHGCDDCHAHTPAGCRFGLDIIGTHWQDCHRAQRHGGEDM